MKQRTYQRRAFILLTTLVLLISSYSPLFAFDIRKAYAAIDLPPSSVDGTIPLTVSPSLAGESTWFYDGMTAIINDQTNQTIGHAYRYRSTNGQYQTMINPGSIGEWADSFGGNRHLVIADVASGTIPTHRLQPPAPKEGFDRLPIVDVIAKSGATYTSVAGTYRITPAPSGPKVTMFKVREIGAACYPMGSTINIDIEVQQFMANQSTLKYAEVYVEHTDTGLATTLKRFYCVLFLN